MSKFIKTKLGCQYEDRKAFYETSEREEDLLYCKKILRPKKEEVNFVSGQLLDYTMMEVLAAILVPEGGSLY
jgi:hypothetical protein